MIIISFNSVNGYHLMPMGGHAAGVMSENVREAVGCTDDPHV